MTIVAGSFLSAPGTPSLVDYGTDFNCPCNATSMGDVDPSLSMLSGRLVLAQALFRRAWAKRGVLFYAPNFGMGLPDMLNSDIGPGDVIVIGNRLDAEYLQDQRVKQSVTVPRFAASVLTLTTAVRDGAGPFSLVLQVSQAGAVLLEPTS